MESLHNTIQSVATQKDNSGNDVVVCPCPEDYDPPEDILIVIEDDPEGCYIDCDIQCYEPKFAAVKEKEVF